MGRAGATAPGERFLRFWLASGVLAGLIMVGAYEWLPAGVYDRAIRFTGFLWCILAAMVAFTRCVYSALLQNLFIGIAYGSTATVCAAHLMSATADPRMATLSRALWLALLVSAGAMYPGADRACGRKGMWLALPVMAAVAAPWSTVDVERLATSIGLIPWTPGILAAMLFFTASYYHSRHRATVPDALSLAFSAHGWAALAYRFPGAELVMIVADAFLLVSVCREGMDIFQREHRLAEYNRRAKMVIDQIGCGVMVLDPEGTVTVCNPAAARLLCVQAAKMIGKPLSRLVENLPRELVPLAAPLSTGGTGSDVRIRTETGFNDLPRYWRIQSSPIEDESGESRGTVVVIEDLTGSKRMEDKTFEARRMASAGKLAAYAAHEIRNPLTAIKGLLHLAQESMSGAAAGSVRSCEGAIDEMEHTMTQILSFAKHGTPKVAFVRLSEILPIPAAGDGDCIDMPMVLADKEILRRGLKAIADSAVGATPGGRGVRISASADEDAGYASIVLDIPGVEVPKHRPSEVFDPSFEVHGAHIGFGLSVGRRLLEESGATVEVVAGGEALRLRVRLRLAREFPAATSTGGDPPK